MSRNRNRVLMLAAATTLAAMGSASAATWDGGDGTWQVGVGSWDGGGNWVDGSSAVFPAAGSGTLTLGGNINVTTMTFSDANYTIDLNGFNLNQSSTTGGAFIPDSTNVVTNTSGTTSTYTLTAADADGMVRIRGNTNVTFNSTGTYIPAAGSDFTGTFLATGGAFVRTDNGPSSVGSASGLIQLDGTNTTLAMSGGLFETYTRNIQLLNNTVRLSPNGLKNITLTGQISGGDLNIVSNQGAVILAGANNYTGTTKITVDSGAGAGLIVANSGALGSSTSVTMGSGDPAMFGLMKNPTTGADITLGSGATLSLTANQPGSGYGMMQNFSGDNTWQGNVALGSNHYRQIGALGGSSLKITGVVGSNADARGLMKLGDGDLILTGANTYGQANIADGTNGTLVAAGKLILDFSQSAVNSNIVNNGAGPGGVFSLTSNRSSQLVLSGGTLEVIGGGAGDTNLQQFSNRSANGFTINPGESRVVATQNGADSLTINVGRIMQDSSGDNGGSGINPGGRHLGGTVDFTLPTTGAIVLGTASGNSVGTAGQILTSNGAAFATVGGNDWAGIDASRNIVGVSTLGGYTANTATTLSGNADMSGGTDTTLAADASTTSLRFHNSGTRSIDIGGNTLTTGGILVTADGNGPTSISNGTLRSQVAGSVIARQDLVIIQRNTSDALTIGATIADNTNPTALTKAGAGTLSLTNGNTYTGPTMATGGVLKLDHASALGGGNLVLKGGVIGLTAASGDFTRQLGAGNGEVRWYGVESVNNIGTGGGVDPITGGNGGFAAYGGVRNVNIGGSGATVQWGRSTSGGNINQYFLRGQSALLLGADDADGTVNWQNPINLANDNTTQYAEREIRVADGSAAVDAVMSGVLSSNEMGLMKTGTGTLELSAANTYDGHTQINGGTLLVTGSLDPLSRVFVNDTGTLGGNGPVGNITVNDGGTVAPGASIDSLESLTVDFVDGSTFAAEINTSTVLSDLLDITGDLNLSGDVTLALSDLGSNVSLPLDTVFTLIAYTGSWNGGIFDGFADDSVFSFGANTYEINYDNDNAVTLTTVVPEPTSLGLLALGGLAALRRRRGDR